jgi:hypothetical protein
MEKDMRAIALLALLVSAPAFAQQGYPARTDCESIVRVLELRPVANGDPSLANYAWDSYVAYCEHLPWSKMIGADTVQEVAKVLHPKLYK